VIANACDCITCSDEHETTRENDQRLQTEKLQKYTQKSSVPGAIDATIVDGKRKSEGED
jgi:hypothetical protein